MPEAHCPTCQETVTVRGDGSCLQCGTQLTEPWSEDPEQVD